MKTIGSHLTRVAVSYALGLAAAASANAADVVRHPLPGGSTFPTRHHTITAY